MSKRRAAYELTRDNCEDDDIPEEPGQFSCANNDQLGQRAIKVAKRRLPNAGDSSKRLFEGFNFGVGTTQSREAATVAVPQIKVSNSIAPSTRNEIISTSLQNDFSREPVDIALNGTGNGDNSSTDRDSEFWSRLSTLNKNILTWIQHHIEDNAFVDLTPVFQDYFKHLETLNKSRRPAPANSETTAVSSSGSSSSSGTTSDSSKVSVNTETQPVQRSDAAAVAPFAFSVTKTNVATTVQPAMFAAVPVKSADASETAEASSSQEQGDDNEPYVPPKVDSVLLEEPGAVYSKLCKLFFKRTQDPSYRDRGKGVLHLKPTSDGKAQLLVRADTALGNVLLNVLLSESMPCLRNGKNNVSLVCVPNPPLDPKNPTQNEPATMLVRVKSAEDADELFALIEKYKKCS